MDKHVSEFRGEITMKKHLIKPKRLRPGDTAAIVSLSSGMLGDPQFRHLYHIARKRIEQDYGLTVLTMPNALRGSEYLYRHPQARAQDLMEAFLNPEVKKSDRSHVVL